MSNLETAPQETRCDGRAAASPVREVLPGAAVALGGTRGMRVTRTLPNRTRRMVGAWCFADLYGPEPATMWVPPHPHTELQTVSWLISGEIRHRDTLGSDQLIRPGQLNLMTAGRGIAHSEEATRSPVLHGIQLWIALPAGHRRIAPHFEHHPDLPVRTDAGLTATVLMGELAGAISPAATYTPLVGAELTLAAGTDTTLPLRPDWEYAVLPVAGAAEVDGVPLAPGPLLYLGTGRTALPLSANQSSRLLLLGGEPFDEQIVMWWNFVARDHDEIVAYRAAWADGQLGAMPGTPLPAPTMPTTRLKPRGRQR